MSLLDAAETVLSDNGEPVHYRQLSDEMLRRGLWMTRSMTPANTVYARIWADIRDRGDESPFVQLGKGLFGLRHWGPSENSPIDVSDPLAPIDHGESPVEAVEAASLSFLDAAEQILDHADQPLHYRDITRQIIGQNLISTSGRTPEATLYAQFMNDINRANRRGETPRFVRQGRGIFGLTRWERHGLAYQIEQHNRGVRDELKDQLLEMTPTAFEELVGRLLVAIGFENVQVTGRSGDGGIDVRGVLVVGDVIRTRMAVQVKRWKQNIQSPTVQQVRGSLGTHDQGLIITTSDFSSGAKEEAEKADRTPVALMNGEQLVALLVENNIGVTREQHDIIDLSDVGEDEE